MPSRASAVRILEERPLLVDEVRVLCNHGRHGALARELAVDLPLHQLVMHEEVEVVALVLL